MTTLIEGVNEDNGFSDEDAISNLVNRWADAEEPSATDEGDPTENVDNDEEDDATELDLSETNEDEEADEAEEGEDNDGDPASGQEATDDHLVTVTVDGETKKVPVRDLKRLFGQEASLTRKSQEVAAARKAADQEGERYVIAAHKMIERAEARFAPFAKIDWLVAQQRLTPDEFAALRSEAKEAHDELTFLKSETDEVLGQLQAAKIASRAEAAKEAIKVLETEIPGWSREVYDKVRAHAVSNGMDPEFVNSVVDPSIIKMMHKAMRLDEAKARAASKKTKTKATPKKIVKPSASSSGKLGTATKGTDALVRLRKSGRDEDAVAALLGRWSDSDD